MKPDGSISKKDDKREKESKQRKVNGNGFVRASEGSQESEHSSVERIDDKIDRGMPMKVIEHGRSDPYPDK